MILKRKMRKLGGLSLDRVDMVPTGAHPGAHIVLAKQEETYEDLRELLRGEIAQFAPGDKEYAYLADFSDEWVVYERDGELLQRTYKIDVDGSVIFGAAVEVKRQTTYVEKSPRELAAVVAKVRAAWLDAHPDKRDALPDVLKETQVPEDKTTKIAEALGLDGEADEAAILAELSKRHSLTEVGKILKLDGDDLTPEKVVEKIGELNKPDPEKTEVEQKLEKAEQRAEEQADEIDKLRKAERRRTFVEKAQEYDKLGQPERIAPLLEAADEHFSEAEQKLLKGLLDGANEQVEKGALFAQLSDPDAESDEGWEERLAKAAKERVAKSTSGLTVEQAKVQIMREDADLRAEYESARS